MTIVSMSEARNNFFKLGEETHMSHKPIIVKGKKFNLVMMDESDWNSIQETLYLYSIPGMVESIKEGGEAPAKDCLDELSW
jgi:PHD/YefM family antitoxin component YafN of YafNO toxin-antitoxin module